MNLTAACVRRELSEVKPWIETCGLIRPLIDASDLAAGEVHERTHEFYYVLGGDGRMALDELEIELHEGVVVYVPRGAKHRAWGDLKVYVVCIPRGVLDDIHEVAPTI